MQGARRQPSCSHLCDLVLSPRQQRRPSIINPALSSQGSSHNMSSHVILFFFFSILHRFLCRQLVTQICRFLHKDCCERERESEGKSFDLLFFLHRVSLKGFGQQMILATQGEKCVARFSWGWFLWFIPCFRKEELSYFAIGWSLLSTSVVLSEKAKYVLWFSASFPYLYSFLSFLNLNKSSYE